MPAKPAELQIAVRYRTVDSASGVTCNSMKRLAERLGVYESQVIYRGLRALAVKVLPQYEADDGLLTAAQMRPLKRALP